MLKVPSSPVHSALGRHRLAKGRRAVSTTDLQGGRGASSSPLLQGGLLQRHSRDGAGPASEEVEVRHPRLPAGAFIQEQPLHRGTTDRHWLGHYVLRSVNFRKNLKGNPPTHHHDLT